MPDRFELLPDGRLAELVRWAGAGSPVGERAVVLLALLELVDRRAVDRKVHWQAEVPTEAGWWWVTWQGFDPVTRRPARMVEAVELVEGRGHLSGAGAKLFIAHGGLPTGCCVEQYRGFYWWARVVPAPPPPPDQRSQPQGSDARKRTPPAHPGRSA